MGIKGAIKNLFSKEKKPVVNKYFIGNKDGCDIYKYSNYSNVSNGHGAYEHRRKYVTFKVIKPFELPDKAENLTECEVIYELDPPRMTIADEFSNDRGYKHSVHVVIGFDRSEMRDNPDYARFVLSILFDMEAEICKGKSDSNVVENSCHYVGSVLKTSDVYGFRFDDRIKNNIMPIGEECADNNPVKASNNDGMNDVANNSNSNANNAQAIVDALKEARDELTLGKNSSDNDLGVGGHVK